MPFNLGPVEMIFVLVVLLMVFGAKRLPELGSGLGKGIREFKQSMREMNDEVNRPEPPSIRNQPPPAQVQAPPQEPAVKEREGEASRRDA
jgi:sec-independent protein translocase protein TatA